MLTKYFEAGGPVMYAVLGAWVVVFAAVLDRLLYVLGLSWSRARREVAALVSRNELGAASRRVERERHTAERGLGRIDAVSQLATSLGLFGTVLGIAQAFFARGPELGLAMPEILAAGLATALFTTIAGLVVFLFGQGFLIAWREWLDFCERHATRIIEDTQQP